jgi:hypothetical protein
LDKQNENDDVDNTHTLKFVADKELIKEYGNFEIQYSELGFRLITEKQPESGCGSCGGSCS